MTTWSCPFCGSDKLKIDTPYLKPVTHEPIQTFCCRSQAKNNEYIKKRYDPRDMNKPDKDDVSRQ